MTYPTDFEFLKLIKIKKRKIKISNESRSDHKYLTRYDIYFDNQEDRIGYVLIRRDQGYVRDVEIDEEYRRKGLASFVYDHIEKDLKIKLRPSSNQLEDGEAFWKNRLKRKNPIDLNFLKQVFVDKETFKITDGKDKIISYQYNVYLNDKRIGYAEIVKGQNTVDDIEVLKPYQRKGLTTFLYDHIENDLKIKLKPSEYLDPDGKKFWENRLKSGKR